MRTAPLEAAQQRLAELVAETVQARVLADDETGTASDERRGFERTGGVEAQLDGTTRTENGYAKVR
ncbi:hypothetical protein [Halorussus halobius]|uniref:hypothetical protein n=1 Tax=Halorussus halobius TaxID=1710537 RepID=UPI0010929F21|nr:hypothetical protein [Halorussus halobius]